NAQGQVTAVSNRALPTANTGTTGVLSSTDWNTFNGKENVLMFNGPLSRSGNTISLAACATGEVYQYDGTTWTCVAQTVDTDTDTDNQTLSYNATTRELTIADGNTVTFPLATGTTAGMAVCDGATGNVFCQNGNSFGSLATIGTNDNNALAFETAGVEVARFTTGGVLGIGTTTPNSIPGFNTNKLEFWDETGAESDFTQRVAGGGWGSYSMLSSNGTLAAATATTDGQSIGQYSFGGYDGTQFIMAADVVAKADGVVSANDMPGRLEFQTTNDGTATPTTKMTIKNNGYVGIGTTTPNSTLQVEGSIATGIITLSSTSAIPDTVEKVLVNNAGAAVTLTLPSAVGRTGRHISISRASNTSSGTITIATAGGSIQNLAGNLTATTTIAANSAAGAGQDINFWSNGTNWYR
nr:hypothetical protein [Candidatus Saccharimonas sp.]